MPQQLILVDEGTSIEKAIDELAMHNGCYTYDGQAPIYLYAEAGDTACVVSDEPIQAAAARKLLTQHYQG